MDKKKRTRELIVFAVIVLALLAGCLLTPSGGESEPIQEVMRDAVLHEQNKVSLFGLIEVNPGLISAYIVTGILIVFALVCRLFVIPKFKYVPGRFQLVLEQIVGMFDGLAEGSSPHRNKFLRAYIFTAGVYIFVSTLFELLGIQVVTTSGHAVSLPAPLSDINGAIALGVMSYGVILFGGLIAAGVGGFLHALKDFSLPISMSFRLFGALLSGALVTELVYYYAALSYVLPHRGRDVHAAARADPGVCFNDAGVDVLRRIDRKAREKAQGKKGKKIPQRNGCLKKEVKLP